MRLSNWISALFQRLFSRSGSQPAPRRSSSSGKPALARDVDPEMREVFLLELEDITKNVENALAAWCKDFSNPAPTRALSRAFHTLKGSAPVIGATQLADLGRAAEQAAKHAGRKRNPDQALIDAITAAAHLLPQWLHAMRHSQPVPDGTVRVTRLLQRAAG